MMTARQGGRLAAIGLLAGTLVILAACQNIDKDTTYPDEYAYKTTGDPYGNPESVLGGEGLSFGFFGDDEEKASSGGPGIGVNAFLWRASLDTISFMPVASADPFGGVIITDWYTPPESPQERFKVNVYILGRELRGDGVRAAVFRQQNDYTVEGGRWIDAPVNKRTSVALEDAILTRARELRIGTGG